MNPSTPLTLKRPASDTAEPLRHAGGAFVLALVLLVLKGLLAPELGGLVLAACGGLAVYALLTVLKSTRRAAEGVTTFDDRHRTMTAGGRTYHTRDLEDVAVVKAGGEYQIEARTRNGDTFKLPGSRRTNRAETAALAELTVRRLNEWNAAVNRFAETTVDPTPAREETPDPVQAALEAHAPWATGTEGEALRRLYEANGGGY